MATIHSSMKGDMEAAKEGLPATGKAIISTMRQDKNMPGRTHDISSEKFLPAEEEKLMLEPADKSDDIIQDDYIGNVSYKMLRDGKQKIVTAGENAGQDIAGRIPPGTGTSSGAVVEQKKLPNAADVKNKIIARLGKKGSAVALAAVLLAGGAFYILWSRELAEKTAMSGDVAANLPPVKEDVSKIADSNDAIRLANLTVLANVAVLYYIEHGADLPVSRDYIKLNEANPVTEFLQDALRRYGQSEGIMQDPRHPDFYYAYKSADGNSIELTARLEDPESSSQCKNEDVCIYRKILTEEDIDNMSDHIERYEP